MLVHQIQIAVVVMLVLMTLYSLLYFVHLLKLAHLPAWILIVVRSLLAVYRRLSISHAGCRDLALSDSCH